MGFLELIGGVFFLSLAAVSGEAALRGRGAEVPVFMTQALTLLALALIVLLWGCAGVCATHWETTAQGTPRGELTASPSVGASVTVGGEIGEERCAAPK